jgi:nucleotide-binding universal stress UspA family protein
MSEQAKSNGSRPKIVVGVDGSEASVEALAWAIEEAGRRGVTVEAVTVWEDPYTVVGPKPHPSIHRPTIIHLHDLQESAERKARAKLSGLGEMAPVHRKQRGGDAVSVLCEMSGRAELLVIGARGVGSLEGTLLGSVSRGCIQKATVPVVVVPPAAVQRRRQRRGERRRPRVASAQHASSRVVRP